jgi:magnesium transporter
MSAPLIAGTKTEHWHIASTGLVLSPDLLLTVRFTRLSAFDALIEQCGDMAAMEPAEIFTQLLEDIVDRAADHLERASGEVAKASRVLFIDERERSRLGKDTALLRDVMRKIGQANDQASRVRYMFLSIGRMAAFVLDRYETRLDRKIKDRLATIRRDIVSLDEFEVSLAGRIQLLLDAATGFINIEQNDVFKLLTIVSVVGVPPVLVVGIYGMNFRHIPELQWNWGYPLALLLCALSAILPLLWFKWRDWL